ncbi:tRNA (guanosine(46)-N7)-methyltransferase TrmB [Algisphaera agarilytica]|uniref:tRNA (guanine-N(7)-)-methyltransferase n=1 Tax=Algisphaera agarilytica TaxID=1385975 RepID=A0A7X0LJP4_9BACT|nr:tRNA (guanosine(46)-N7)-methyltransferase TrmB [Algisphaera agarilytica]MBB6429585.1 tRNA (guanine-N7-)-methyltransferase [Algisphaera agarilytica]
MANPPSKTESLDVTGYGFSQDDLPELDHGPLDLRTWFKFERTAQAEGPGAGFDLEIGSGKGTFLVQQAGLEPEVDFLGVEWSKKFWRLAADRARRHGLGNVRLLWADATVFVRNYVADEALRRVHIYFPDPWPKARHNKRRSVQAPFLRELHRVLQPGGEIRLATDHADYFQWMQEHAAQVEDLFERRPFERPASAGEGELVGTNFERKYIREGREFQAMILVKRDPGR